MAKLEHPKNNLQRKIEKQSVEFSAEVADMWSATMDISTSMTKIGTIYIECGCRMDTPSNRA